jgi:hypothetical protein
MVSSLLKMSVSFVLELAWHATHASSQITEVSDSGLPAYRLEYLDRLAVSFSLVWLLVICMAVIGTLFVPNHSRTCPGYFSSCIVHARAQIGWRLEVQDKSLKSFGHNAYLIRRKIRFLRQGADI